MEEEDPIVEEIPVYLSKSLAENLYIFQFSTKDAHYTIDCNDVVNSCAKPHNQQASVKVDFGLETKSRNYDEFRGAQLAVGADGKNPSKGDRPSFPSGTMDKMSFVSSKSVQKSGNFVIGVMQDREIHTTPLQGILQMRPSFSYFDKQDARRRAEQKNDTDVEAEEEMKQVTVRFARSDSEKARKAREKTFDFMAAREAEEPWCETFWHPTGSTAVELERTKLFCTKTAPTGHALTATSNDYVRALIPREGNDKSVETIVPSGIVSLCAVILLLDKQDARRRAEQKNDTDVEAEEEMKQVTVRFARSDSEKARKAREKTFDFMAAREAEEPWCETFWHPTGSTAVELERTKLFCTKTAPTGHALTATSNDYVRALIPREGNDKSVETIVPSGIVSLYQMKEMGLQEQIKNILIDVVTCNNCGQFTDHSCFLFLGFPIIKGSPKHSQGPYWEMRVGRGLQITQARIHITVVRILPLIGLLIRGNWVIQSEVLYPAESFSSTNGIPSEVMCRSRDYVLYQLVRRNFVDRQKIGVVIQLPPEEVKEILMSVAQVSSRGWELPLMPDVRFESKYPELVQRQEMFWRSKEDLFSEMESEKVPKRVRKRSIREPSKVPAVNGMV
uniref:Putative rna polymerase c iii 37 kDa subunit n=1 Tax=Lutzomyia longipalpis TaxID=7200 RepID=A0A1B0CN87_LUTLO